MGDRIRIGLAGLGHRGQHWLRLLQRVGGYEVVALAGVRLRRQDFKEAESLTTSMTFVSIFAGLR